MTVIRRAIVLLLCAGVSADAQAPHINPGGVVSAASWASPIAPGELISIFGTNFGGNFGIGPGTTVTVNGVAAPVVFVSPTQINAVVPATLTTTAAPGLAAAGVVVTTAAGSSTAEIAALAASVPGFFTADSSGCGQAAALNVAPNGSLTVNSPASSAAPGDYLAIFGTGFGPAAPTVFLDNNPLPSVSYAGPAPGLAGVDQLNLQLPATTRNGCNVPFSASGFWAGPTVTLSVQAGRGKCVDPPIQSYGTISFIKSMAPGTGAVPAAADFFNASFPSGPNVQPPSQEQIVFAPNWAVSENAGGIAIAILSPAPIYPRSCTVPGYGNLSAGTIQLQSQSGNPVAVVPSSPGFYYGSLLPAGFIGPGQYSFTGTSGSAVALSAALNVGSAIQLQTTFAAGTAIAQSQPLTIKWTGGDPGTLVRVALTSQFGSSTRTDYSYAPATAGSITIPPQCTGSVCTFDLPLSTDAQIEVSVVPVQPTTVSAPGITGQVQLTWSYVYEFAGLTLTN